MAVPWPATLQQLVNEGGFTMTIGDTSVRSDMDTGLPKIRRRFTKSIDFANVNIWVDVAQYNTWRTFYDTSIDGGTLAFELEHPITGVLTEFLIIGAPQVTPIGGGRFAVSMVWEIQPQ